MTLLLFGLEGNCLESRETRRDRPKPPPRAKNPPRQPATARNYNPRITFVREKLCNFGKNCITRFSSEPPPRKP